MTQYNFLYRDNSVDWRTFNGYKIGEYLYEETAFCASFLRGGLLSGCNLRFLITLEIGKTLIWADTDYSKRGLYTFDVDWYYEILDVYIVGDYCQVLLTPNLLLNAVKKEVTLAARGDFIQLFNTPPVQVLNTPEWRRKTAYVIGNDRIRIEHKPSVDNG
jgi:hypothetical protein